MPSDLTQAQLLRVAALARLEVGDEEAAVLARQLGEILTYAEQILEISTSRVAPTTHLPAQQLRLREDEPREGLSQAEALANAPQGTADSGLFTVPRVLG